MEHSLKSVLEITGVVLFLFALFFRWMEQRKKAKRKRMARQLLIKYYLGG